MKLAALTMIAVLLVGCSRTIEATPVKAPQDRIDCNLIFPGPSSS